MATKYAFYQFIKNLPEMRASVARLVDTMIAAGQGDYAARILSAFRAHEAELLVMARAVASEGSKILREHERDSRVRPDTLGGGGPRLEDNLFCDPLPEIPGSVGVANEDVLDEKVEWWWTNEEGYDGHVGRVLFGTFQPGDAPPSSTEFQVHPLFRPGSGGSGVIRNPIEARYFVRDSIPEIDALWGDSWLALVDQFQAERDALVDAALLAV